MSNNGFGVATEPEELSFPGMGLLPEGVTIGYVNGTDSLHLDDDRLPPDVDEAWADSLDHEADEAAIKEVMAPAGYYETDRLFLSRKDQPGEPRKTFFYGTGVREAGGKTYTPRLRFTISPDKAYGKTDGVEDESKLAHAYNLYLSAKRAFQTVTGEKPRTRTELEDYLTTSPLKLRTMQGNDGLVVLDIVGIKV